MPRFDRGVVNTKLEKGDIVLMGNPTQYGEILAENILVEDILKADLETLISGSNLVRGKFYRITNAVSSTLSLLVQGLTANTICDYAYNTANGELVAYNISTDLASVPFASVYVPYTGATADVDLGEYQIKVGQLELDQTPTGTFGVGKIRWNDTDGTPEVMLKGANVTLQIGQEQLARVVNKTNTNLTEAGYQVVRISGAQGQRLKVGLAQANSTSTCKDTLGLVTENISNNAEGFITTSGLVRSINTTGSLQGETWADGDRLYLSPSVAGGITNVEPSAPNIVIVLGYVVYAHATQGSIYVSVEGAKALHELFDVSIPTPTNNNVLVYESSTGLWKDKSISTILGFTPIANNATVGGELSGTLPNPSLVTSAVTGKALTGLSVSGSAVVSTDSILTGIGKLQNQINAVVGSVNFQGVWNASTNSPSLASGVGTKGYYYVVSVAGSTNLDGITDWKLGDWAIYDGSAWQKVDNTDAVVSVNGYTGIVTLAAADVGALPTSAISGTTGKLAKFTSSGTVGNSIVSESGSIISIDGSLNIGNGITTGNVDFSINGSSGVRFDLTNGILGINRGSGLDIRLYYAGGNTAFRVSNSSGELFINRTPTTSAGTFDLITRNTSTGAVEKVASNYYATAGSISGTTGKLAKFTASGTIGDSIVSESGSLITVSGYVLSTNFTSTTVSDTIDVGTVANNPEYNFIGKSGFWGIRTNTSYEFNIDVYNSGTPKNTLKIKQNGNIITNGATDTGEAHIFGGSARVNGALQATSTITSGASGASDGSFLLKRASDGLSVAEYSINTTSSLAKLSTAYTFLTFETEEIERVRIAGGNVGIGTTSPNFTSAGRTVVDINGSTSSMLAMSIGGTASAYLFSSAVALELNAVGAVPILFSNNAGERARVSGGGNFLIGTTTDDGVNKLQVSGAIAAQSLVIKTSGIPAVQLFRDLDATIVGGAGQFLEFGARSGSSYVSAVSILGVLETSGTDGRLEFKTLTSGSMSTKLTIASTGAATFSSSVAIGNTVTASVATPSTHKVEMVIGGVTYYLLATT